MAYKKCLTQNDLLLDNLKDFYQDKTYLNKMVDIINGNSKISLRIVDWFVTNYSKKYFVVYEIKNSDSVDRFKVYNDYKLKLKAYSKKRFDPFCRWERISFPYKDGSCIETTIGQLNFFKWALENKIVDYIEKSYGAIEQDMNERNSSSKKRVSMDNDLTKTRKKREELSISATKCIKKEEVKIIVKFE